MQLPGMLVEHLINGSVALIWLLPFLRIMGYPIDNTALVALFVPGLYDLGMLVDYASSELLGPLRNRFRYNAYKKLHVDEKVMRGIEIKLLVHTPELARAYEMRKSRHRIARGTLLNCIIATMSLALYFQAVPSPDLDLSIILAGVVITLLFFVLWARLLEQTYRFRVESWRALQELLETNRPKSKIPGNPV